MQSGGGTGSVRSSERWSVHVLIIVGTFVVSEASCKSRRPDDSCPKDPLVPEVCCTTRCSDKPDDNGNEERKSKNTQRKNTDGPPRHVHMLGAISNRRSPESRIAGRYARRLLRGRVRMVLAAMVAMRHGGRREIVVVIVVVVVVLSVE
jgi:hypothetical protein